MFENVKQNPFRRINFGKLPKTNPVPPSRPSNRGNFLSTVFVSSRFENVKQNPFRRINFGKLTKGNPVPPLGLAVKRLPLLPHLLYLCLAGTEKCWISEN